MEDSKSITKGCCILAALVFATFNTKAANVAPVRLTGQSMFGLGTPEHGSRLIFSTPDTALGLPQHTVGANGNLVMNGEWRPVTNAIGVYESDAMAIPDSVDLSQVRATDVLFGGKLRLFFPTNDVDTNGVLDVLQIDKGNDAYITGGGITEYSTNGQRFHTAIPFESAWVTGGGPVGSLAYHWDIMEDPVGLDAPGQLYLLYMNGSVTNRGNTALIFGLRSTNDFGGYTYRGIAPARFRQGELRIGKFNLKRNDGVKIRVNKTTLRLVNGQYIGKLSFNDWNPTTPWADYTEWAIEIGQFVRP